MEFLNIHISIDAVEVSSCLVVGATFATSAELCSGLITSLNENLRRTAPARGIIKVDILRWCLLYLIPVRIYCLNAY
jgi:hypothetical protein